MPTIATTPHRHRHGTLANYYKVGCRCEPCEAAHAHHLAECSRRDRLRRVPGYQPQRSRLNLTPEARRERYREQMRRARRNWQQKNREHRRAYKRQWAKDNPEKVRQYELNRRARHVAACGEPITHTWPFARRAAAADHTIATINAAVPRSLPEHIRQDVCQELAIVLLTEGAITAADVQRAIRQTWRAYPVIAGHTPSLDAARYSFDGQTRERWIDQVPDPACLSVLSTPARFNFAR